MKLVELLQVIFYRHGVFCASYPYMVIVVTAFFSIYLSSPVVKKIYTKFSADISKLLYKKPIQFWETPSSRQPEFFVEKYGGKPFLYLQQIFINSSDTASKYTTQEGRIATGVLDKENFISSLDLQQRLLSIDVPCSTSHSHKQCTLDDICFKPGNDSRCLFHSPLEYWNSSFDKLVGDDDILNTLANENIVSSFNIPLPRTSVLGGVVVNKDAGRVKVQGASEIILTYFVKQGGGVDDSNGFDEYIVIWDRIVDKLVLEFSNKAPLLVPGIIATATASISNTEIPLGLSGIVLSNSAEEVKHLYYEVGQSTSIITGEFLILLISYILVFLYISLVMSKVDLVKSKFGLGFAAVMMIFSSLLMSVGLWEFLGVDTMLVPWEILPFMVLAIGVENIFVLTNSIVSTSMDLPVKKRVGIGLSKVALKMSFSLVGEMGMLLFGSLINMRALQEFCQFAAVSVVMDYFVQITFFVSVLSIDIRRLELSELHKLSRTPNTSTKNDDTQNLSSSSDKNKKNSWSLLKYFPSGLIRKFRRALCSWSAVLMLFIMILLGFGIYGSSSSDITSIPDHNNSTATSNQETAEVFWSIINPSQSAKYVEISPPKHVMFMKNTRPSEIQPASTPTPPNEPYIEPMNNPLHDLSPTVLITIVVTSLVLVILITITVSSLLYYISFATPKLYRHWTHLPTNNTEKNSAFEQWNNGEVNEIWSGCWRDVAKLSSIDGLLIWDDAGGGIWGNSSTTEEGTFKISSGKLLNVSGGLCFVNKTDGELQVFDLKRDDLIQYSASFNLPDMVKRKILFLETKMYEEKHQFFVVALTGGVIELWPLLPQIRQYTDVNTDLIGTLTPDNPSEITYMYVSTSRDFIIIGDQDGNIHCWNIPFEVILAGLDIDKTRIRHRKLVGHDKSISFITLDSKSGLLVSGAADGSIRFWDIETGKGLLKIDSDDNKEHTPTLYKNNSGSGIRKRNAAKPKKKTSTVSKNTAPTYHISKITKIEIYCVKESFASSIYTLITSSIDGVVMFWRIKVEVDNPGSDVVSHISRRGSTSSKLPALLSSTLNPSPASPTTPSSEYSLSGNLSYFPPVSLFVSCVPLGSLIQLGGNTFGVNDDLILFGVRRIKNSRSLEWNWELWMVDLANEEPLRTFKTIKVAKDDLYSGTNPHLEKESCVFQMGAVDASRPSWYGGLFRKSKHQKFDVDTINQERFQWEPSSVPPSPVPSTEAINDSFTLNCRRYPKFWCTIQTINKIPENVPPIPSEDVPCPSASDDDDEGWETDETISRKSKERAALLEKEKKRQQHEAEDREKMPVLEVCCVDSFSFGVSQGFALVLGNYIKLIKHVE